MQVNNEIYQTYGHDWWSEDASFAFSSLRYCMNPVRYGYFKRMLQQLQLPGRTLLDVGCGGGFLAEEFARDGFTVTGIDPATRSLEAARKHAVENNLEIDYRAGRGEALPFPDGSFDIVACCDVLEHVDDFSLVISEVARTLKAGGVFCYDTINRTWLSKVAVIKISQDWGFTKWIPPNSHVWERFIKPAELIAAMNRCGIANQDLTGIASRKNPLALFANLRALRKGRLSNREIAAAFALCETEDLRISYMGYAVRSSSV
ncbi:MAG: bifunctional 2-polyprenyl-6-hydroxyphenol methylase/3-demethylubiquinol 3-O-methyltransferase UbiG [Salinivirgaceae bacterium]|nr:bifunctional 2-polyprenyl-6-hydroxyphenol methylase/3-demethylubiquinol 3-O-methyltransferase UbiG [Salinivirgaceae bacterium]